MPWAADRPHDQHAVDGNPRLGQFPVNPHDLPHLLRGAVASARAAGEAILGYYRNGVTVREKADESPVTEADVAAETIILRDLAVLTPGVPVVSEEASERGGIPPHPGAHFWLVDPLDGTREFIKRNDEFTVNIALIDHGRPVLGVVYAPALGELYAGTVPGGATLQTGTGPAHRISARQPLEGGVVVVASRSHMDEATRRYLATLTVKSEHRVGSSLKFGVVAAGRADIYPRFGTTMEWDTAAGHAVLLAAGGSVTTLDHADLHYGKPGFRNPNFVARGRWKA